MSSFYDLASLVMIPSGKKAGKVYSQKPLTTDGQLDFTRASTATRIGPDGKIEKTRTNNLLYSNDFSNAAWVDNAGGCTRTSGQSGYDGTNNAWLLTQNGVTGFDNIVQNVSSTGVNTYSIYAKGSSTGFTLRIANTTDRVLFNLSTGSVASTFGNNLIDSGITAVGGGWYRCYLTANATIANLNIYPLWQSTSAESVTIQDAQLEPGLVATNVITTTTAAVSVGSVDNMPRLNYTPGSATSCPSLLLEPQRTNLLAHSEYIGAFGASNVSVTSNTEISPQGVRNAATIEVTNQTSVEGIAQGFVADGSSLYTISAYYKKTTSSTRAHLKIRDLLGSGTTYGFVDFDLSDGDVSSFIGTYSITSFNEDWWYVVVTTSSAPSAGIRRAIVRLDNQPVGTQISLFGFQVEAGSYPTSYIPTFGATVTRVADSCSKTGISGLIGQTEGTLFFDIKDTTNLNAYVGIDNSSSGTRIIMYSLSDGKIYTQVRNGGTIIFSVASSVLNGRAKAAVAFNGSESIFYVNGTQIGSGSGTTYTNLSKVTFNHSSQVGVEINQNLVFKTRLTNDQLAELTSTDS